MERRSFLTHSALGLATLAVNPTKLFANLLQQSDYSFKPLRNDIGFFNEKGGTIAWLNSPDGYVVVDSQFPDSASHLINELKRLGEKPFLSLFNTHHHSDHTAGNIAFKSLVKQVIAHENSLQNQKNVSQKDGTAANQLYPNTVFSDHYSLSTPKESMVTYYYGPAHTNGDSIVHFENSNIVHMGDLVFNRNFPYIDRSAGANISDWIEALQNIREDFDGDTLYIFGHALDPNKVTGKADDLKAFQQYLESLLQYVFKQIKNGVSLAKILETEEIPGASQWKGKGIERGLKAAYEELTQ